MAYCSKSPTTIITPNIYFKRKLLIAANSGNYDNYDSLQHGNYSSIITLLTMITIFGAGIVANIYLKIKIQGAKYTPYIWVK